MIALFIDGPLAGEVKDLPPPNSSRYMVPLPRRITTCLCDPHEALEHDEPPATFTYHLVAQGPKVLIYTESEDDEDIARALQIWRQSDFSVPAWSINCRDRRAFW